MWDLEKYSTNTAIITESGDNIGYGELKAEADSLYEHISHRCLVMLFCENSFGSVMGYISFTSNDVVPIMVDALLDKELLKRLIQTYKPEYLWLPTSGRNEFIDYAEVYSAYDYVLLKTNYSKIYALNDQLAVLLTTSGSTGSPKLVRQSYNNISENTKAIIDYLRINENERAITTLPMNYTYGLSIIQTHIMAGATIILTKCNVFDRVFWQQFKLFEATSFGGVPYTYEMLNRLRFFNMDLPSLKTMTQAGGKLSAELHRKFAEYAINTGREFFVMYGATEATARMGYLPYQRSMEKYGSMGIAIPGGEFSLRDVDGQEIKNSDEVGELVYKGANVTLGYAENGRDLIKGDERDGIYCTGDMAKRDEDGFYYITGRKKRFLKMFGSRVNMDEIEQLIKAHYVGIDCACNGCDDALYIFLTEMDMVKPVTHFVAEKTGINHLAIRGKYIPEIPKSDSGKTLFRELGKYYD